MEIRNVLSSVYKNDDKFKAPSGKSADVTKKDKIEISEQAKALQNTGETKNLAEIQKKIESGFYNSCLLYTSDAADERSSVDLGGRRIIKKKKEQKRKKKKEKKKK